MIGGNWAGSPPSPWRNSTPGGRPAPAGYQIDVSRGRFAPRESDKMRDGGRAATCERAAERDATERAAAPDDDAARAPPQPDTRPPQPANKTSISANPPTRRMRR